MTTRLVLLLAFVLGSHSTATARLGDTREQAEARYGSLSVEVGSKPTRPLVQGAQEVVFSHKGWLIRCAFLMATDGKWYVVREEYTKQWNGAVMKHERDLAIHDLERVEVFRMEAGQSPWKEQRVADSLAGHSPNIRAKFTALAGVTGKLWHGPGGAMARMPSGKQSILLELPQAAKHEEQLQASRTRAVPYPTQTSPAPTTRTTVSGLRTGQPSQASSLASKEATLYPSERSSSTVASSVPAELHKEPQTQKPSSVTTGAKSYPDKRILERTNPSATPDILPEQDAQPDPSDWLALKCTLLLIGTGIAALFIPEVRRFLRQDIIAHTARSGITPSASHEAGTEADGRLSMKPRDFRNLAWDEFEILVGEIYRVQGYAVTINNASGADGGIDLVLTRDDERVLVQCKNWNGTKVTAKEIREFFGVIISESATRGIFVTSSSYTRDAQEFAAGKPLELIDREKLLELVDQTQKTSFVDLFDVSQWAPLFALSVKRTTPPCPFCRSKMVLRNSSRGKFWGCSTFPKCRGKREARRYLVASVT